MKTERVLKKNAIKAYKAFNSDLTCKGFQYEVGKEYRHKGKLEVCWSGFHACPKLAGCFRFYPFNETKTRVAEVLVWGKIEHEDVDVKLCASNIKVVRELAWGEVLSLCNTGDNNSGRHNSGDNNSGNWNSGDWNSGNWNSGNWNSGDNNIGHHNSCSNNSGDWNTGYGNSGHHNSGSWNSGDNNSGNYNSGNYNSGANNSGKYNTGYVNSGDWNSGNGNSGDWNSGDNNIGHHNSCSNNSGDWNTGYGNSGHHNSGSWNSGDWNSGYLNTSAQKYSFIFNKPVEKSVLAHIEFPEFMRFILTEWIPDSKMSQQEKEQHPEYVTTGGYLKKYDYKEAFRKSFEVAKKKADWPEQLEKLKALPNFDAKIFEEISGITPKELGISAKELADKAKTVMEVTMADIEKVFGCKIKLVEEK